jgi:hypothetical protein
MPPLGGSASYNLCGRCESVLIKGPEHLNEKSQKNTYKKSEAAKDSILALLFYRIAKLFLLKVGCFVILSGLPVGVCDEA